MAANNVIHLTRDQLRSRRARVVRARTISVKRLTKRDLKLGRELYPDTGYSRPKVRGDCKSGVRPCPYVTCKHNLYLDVSEKTGSITLNFPDLEVSEMSESCVLDVSDASGQTLEYVAQLMNITRERVRQVEVIALGKLEQPFERIL